MARPDTVAPMLAADFRAIGMSPRGSRTSESYQQEQLIERIISACLVYGGAADLLMNIYITGLYHGAQASKGWPK
jgi:hypothetical protein